jgi:hypothetical protein
MLTKKQIFLDKRFCPSCGGEFCKSDGTEILPTPYKRLEGVFIHKCGWTGRLVEFVGCVSIRKIKLEKLEKLNYEK